MNIGFKALIASLAVVYVLGYATGRYLQPARIEVHTEVQTQTVTVVQHDVQVVTKEIDRPDGTKEIDTVTTDKSHDQTNTDTQSQTDKVVTAANKPQWLVGTEFIPGNAYIGHFYGASVQHRLLGPIFLGIGVDTNRQVGLTVTLEF